MDKRKSPQTPPLTTYYGFILVKKCNGSEVGGCFPVIKKEIIIGRHYSCDIKIFLSSVSDIHCIIQYINELAYIRDKSTSGTTKVNGKKIGRNNFLLNHSDEIEICGRKFVWEYASSYVELHKSQKKSGTKRHCITPRASKQLSNHTTPLVLQDCSKLLTSAKSVTKTPSKTLISYNKTPIVVAATSVSKLSFDELKNSFKRQNSTTITRSRHRPTKSSMVSSLNTQIIDDTNLTPRKLWFVTPSSRNSTSNGTFVLDRLSNKRLKRDCTPEFNSSYCNDDKSLQFDSPCLVHNKEQTDDNINISVTANNLHNTNDQSDLQFSKDFLKIDISTNISTDDDDNIEIKINEVMNKTSTNVGNTSFGKTHHEPTHLTLSKNSKSKFNSSYVQLNDTSNDISQITDFQNNVSIPEGVKKNIAYSPLPNLNVWSQMMNDFNESVKKEQFSVGGNGKDFDISTDSKVLFNDKTINACPTIQVISPEEVLLNDDVNMEGNKSGTKRENTIQCSLVSLCLPNNATETPRVSETMQSTSNSDNLLKKSIVRTESLRCKSVLAESNEKAQIPKSTSFIENVSNPTLTELILPKINKKNKILDPIKTNSNKIDKPIKKMKSTKLNKRTQSKLVLPSNPIKPNTDTSKYESNDNTSEPLLGDCSSKTSTKKTKKNLKENPQSVTKIKELMLKVTSSQCTKSRKHLVNKPVFQPNSKSPKCDPSTKSAITEISSVTSLLQSQTLSSKRCLRSKSKLKSSQISDNSLPKTAVNKNYKCVSQAKKQGLSSKDSCDSAPSVKNITRQQANIKKTELKKSATSRTKDKILSVFNTGTRVRFEKNVEEMTISPMKTRSTTKTVPKRSLRVLETRRKKYIFFK